MARRSAVEGAGRFNRTPSPTTSCLPSFILTATSLGRLLAQTPLPDEAREEHVAALREVIKEKRPDQKRVRPRFERWVRFLWPIEAAIAASCSGVAWPRRGMRSSVASSQAGGGGGGGKCSSAVLSSSSSSSSQ